MANENVKEGAASILAKLKEENQFDLFLATELALHIKQSHPLDVDRLVDEIKREINPKLHEVLPE